MLKNIRVDSIFGCWLYTGRLDKDGYGKVFEGCFAKYAHRVAWEREFGPVPDGLVLDHACKRRNCCNPAHLEPVTQSENLRRRKWGRRGVREKCKNGHSLANAAVTERGGKLCRVCQTGGQ